MPHGPRRFAKNSENVRHFRLIARSQKDSEGDNEEASGLVLEPFVPSALKGKVDEEAMLTIPESLQGLGPEVFGIQCRGEREECSSGEEEDDDEERDEMEVLDDECYFPKDGYNYNQHLRTLSKNKKTGGVGGKLLDAPRSDDMGHYPTLEVVRVEENPEAAGYAAMLINHQPVANNEEDEVMQALMDCDNPGYEEIEDDFLDGMVASGPAEPEAMMWGPNAADDHMPDLAMFKEMHAQRLAMMGGEDEDEPYIEEDECEGSRQPGQAVSSENFAQLLEDEYADENDGALDDDEIEGTMGEEDLEALLDDYLDNREAEKQNLDSVNEPIAGKYDNVPRTIDETRAIIERHYDTVNYDDDAEAPTTDGESDEDESKNWDCETVLTSLSNISNRPGKINKIKLAKKPKAEKDLAAVVEGSDDEDESDEDAVELPDVCTDRPKNESPEDKKARKNAVKEMRRICRKMKKESKEMYKNEASKLNKKGTGTGDIREGLRCMKL